METNLTESRAKPTEETLFVPGFLDKRVTDKRFALARGKERKTWQVEQVWELHHEITRRIFLGQKNTVIATAVGCDKQQVSNVRNSAIVQEQLRAMQVAATLDVVDVKRIINEIAPRAVEVLKEVMEAAETPPATRVSAAKDLLDRAGHGAVQQVQVAHGHFTAADLDAIKLRAMQSTKVNGLLVEEDKEDNAVIDITPERSEIRPEQCSLNLNSELAHGN
jgi:hypothetical protein